MASASPEVVTEPAIAEHESSLPPIPEKILASYRRMWREPQVLWSYHEGTWVAFSGERIVAAGLSLEDVVRAAEEAGEPDPSMVPILSDVVLGL